MSRGSAESAALKTCRGWFLNSCLIWGCVINYKEQFEAIIEKKQCYEKRNAYIIFILKILLRNVVYIRLV